MPSGEDRWDVFLAHASPDKPRARALYDALVALDLKVFLDEESLLPGGDWPTEIPQALRTSDVVVVLVSALTAKAHYAGEEIVISIAETRAGRQRLVPVHIERDVEDPYGIARKNRIDWHDMADVGPVVTQLCRVIPSILRGATTNAPIFSRRVPAPPPHFTGREELLTQLAAQLGGGRTTTLTQEIQGMGGVGKTTVAAALCEDQLMHHDIVWWVRAEDPGTLVADLAELAGHVGATTGRGGDADADAVVASLETSDLSWLVVYDNVPDRESVLRWLPKRGPGTPVVTTRYRHLGLGTLVTVGILSADTAEAFLRERVKERNAIAADEPLGPVLERVRGLPLAMEQAAAWVARKPNRRFSQWVDLYDERADLAFPDGTKPVDYEHTAVTTWRVSIDAAGKESPLAERLLGALGHFAPEGIAIQWLKDVADDPYLDGATADDVGAAIDALDDYDLVTINADDTIDIHRIIHDTARRTATEGAASFAVRTIIAQDPGGRRHADWPLLSQLSPHARQMASTPAETYGEATHALVRLLARTAKVASYRGDCREALQAATVGDALGRAQLPGSETCVRVRDALATAYEYAGDLDRSVELYESALAEGEETLGPDAPLTITTRANLGSALRNRGDLDRAIPLLEAALAGCERTFGLESDDTIASRGNLAAAHQAAGDLPRAVELHKATVEQAERSNGPTHPTTLIAMGHLAHGYQAMGRLDLAVPLQETTLRIEEETLGPNDRSTLIAKHNLAWSYYKLGDRRRAIALLDEAVAGLEITLGPEHPISVKVRHGREAMGSGDG